MVAAAEGDFLTAPELTPAEKVALEYASTLTIAARALGETHVTALRQHYDDQAILEINAVVAYRNFVNRVALGLGVDLEDSLRKFTR